MQQSQSFTIPVLQVSEIQLKAQSHPFLALIGRDILDKCTMNYQGPQKNLTLIF